MMRDTKSSLNIGIMTNSNKIRGFIMIKLTILYFSILMVFSACSDYNDVDHSPSVIGDIADSDSWYDDMVDEVLEMRVIIPTPNDFNCTDFNDTNGTLRPCTLADINSDIDANDDYEPELHVNMQTDDFTSPNEMMNASFEQKGKTTRKAKQKSYRIKLDSKENLYKDERTYQLNKHPYDNSRVRNKLAFDLLKTIPHITSLKTEFIHLDIDSSEHNISDENSSDYGLFTHVEKVGKEFLINRGWSKEDYLWKAQNFSFRLHAGLAIDKDGKPIDPEAFDSILERERGKDQTKLHEMLESVNSHDIDTVEKYFNRNNYLTWMAVNIVMGNKDTVSQNFFLYNPLYSDTFYFLPWDYDGAARANEEYGKPELGISNWWDVPLHKKFLSVKQNRKDLDDMVNNLRANYITSEIIQERLDIYKPLIEKYILRQPDNKLEYIEWQNEFNILIPRLEDNIANYKSQEGHPMSFWQVAEYNTTVDGLLNLAWGKSIDFEGDAITYDLVIATTPALSDTVIYHKEDIADIGIKNDIFLSVDIELEAGTYYMKVISREIENPTHYQIAFDQISETFLDDSGGLAYKTYFGVLEFVVE